MPTTNLTVTDTWTEVAANNDAGFLISGTDVGYIEYATTATATVPDSDLRGHVVPRTTLVGRGLLGPGYVWARVLPPHNASTIAVSKS